MHLSFTIRPLVSQAFWVCGRQLAPHCVTDQSGASVQSGETRRQTIAGSLENHQTSQASNHQTSTAAGSLDNHHTFLHTACLDIHQTSPAAGSLDNHQIYLPAGCLDNHKTSRASESLDNHQTSKSAGSLDNHYTSRPGKPSTEQSRSNMSTEPVGISCLSKTSVQLWVKWMENICSSNFLL